MISTRKTYSVTLYTYVSENTHDLIKVTQKNSPTFTLTTKTKNVKAYPIEMTESDEMDYMYYMNIHDICSSNIQLADIKIELSMN